MDRRAGAAGVWLFGSLLALPAAAAPGDFLVTEFEGDSVVDISAGDDVSADMRFATGLAGPVSLCVGPNDDIYVSNFGDGSIDIITDGGDYSAVAAFAVGLGSPGQLLCSTGIVLVTDLGGRVLDVTAGGDFSGDQGWAWDDNGTAWSGLIREGGGTVYVSAFTQGEIYDISGGGDFTGATAFATGVPNATILSDSSAGLLVTHGLLGVIKDFSPGDDISDDPVWADVPNVVSVYDRGSDGVWALGEDPATNTGAVWDVTGGGDFDMVEPFAYGIASLGLAAGGMLFHVCQVDNDCDDNDVCNGDETCGLNACTPGTSLDCDDGDECTADSCDAVLGCANDPIDGCGGTTGTGTGTGTSSGTGTGSSGGFDPTTSGGLELTTGSTGTPDPDTGSSTGTPEPPPTSAGPSSSTASASGTTTPPASGTGTDTDGADEDSASDDGCGCRSTTPPYGVLPLLVLLVLRRRCG